VSELHLIVVPDEWAGIGPYDPHDSEWAYARGLAAMNQLIGKLNDAAELIRRGLIGNDGLPVPVHRADPGATIRYMEEELRRKSAAWATQLLKTPAYHPGGIVNQVAGGQA
jgi:hypothetical protein